MSKNALYIPRPGETSRMIQNGYVDTLRHLGWKVYVGNPKSKLGCKETIIRYDISFIMTHSKYGMRQLPIDTINSNGIVVAIELLPLNETNSTISGPHELAHDDETDIIKSIDSVVVHTRLEPHAWNLYMNTWLKHDSDILHLPAAGNIIGAIPTTCATLTDVAMVANFAHRQNILRILIEPLFERIELLGYSYQAFGDEFWAKAGLNYSGPLIGNTSQLAQIYATARVCPNVHTERQVTQQTGVNERSFMIPLCGGIQVSDNPLAQKYLGENCTISRTLTEFISNVIGLIDNQPNRSEKIRSSVNHIAHNHTYFNRLEDLFTVAGLHDCATEVKEEGYRVAVKHCWEMDARLSAEERGVPYEQNVV
jgi:hypothetical protein